MILDEIIKRTEKRVAQLPITFPENGAGNHASLIDANTDQERQECSYRRD